MRHYEVTFIVDPVLSGDEIKATAQAYREELESYGASIVHVDEMGLRQLAYPINKRTSGVYYCIEITVENGTFVEKLELSMRRDDRILRFLTYGLDKYGVKYNDDKRNGRIGKKKKEQDNVKDSPAKDKASKTQAKASLSKKTVEKVAGKGDAK